jgi:hypothetical protein
MLPFTHNMNYQILALNPWNYVPGCKEDNGNLGKQQNDLQRLIEPIEQFGTQTW